MWSADANELAQSARLSSPVITRRLVSGTARTKLASRSVYSFVFDCLEPDAVYQVAIGAQAQPNQWSLIVLEEQTGARLCTREIGEKKKRTNESAQLRVLDGVFRTGRNNRVIIGVLPNIKAGAEPFHISRLNDPQGSRGAGKRRSLICEDQ